ncbi:hypothetical protein M3Y94_00099000 [Aphelenchoides besseyi]|nr:hypothetical protein M3Y94_00099000 [Aphelenchoides besseyi]KAI6237618.1 hypothetical protein M3Y95_00284300 [Aphelenchoides besseyi]
MSRDRCLCGIQVHDATLISACFVFVISLVSLLGSVEGLLSDWIQRLFDPSRLLGKEEAQTNSFSYYWRRFYEVSHYINIAIVVFWAVNVFAALLLIYGNRKQKSSLYVPYLILNGIFITVSYVVIAVITLATILWYFGWGRNDLHGLIRIGVTLFILFLMTAFLVFISLYYYFFFSVVLRSKALLTPPSPPVDVIIHRPSNDRDPRNDRKGNSPLL